MRPTAPALVAAIAGLVLFAAAVLRAGPMRRADAAEADLAGARQAVAAAHLRSDAAEIRALEAFQRGWREGYREGLDLMRADFSSAVDAIRVIADGCVYLPRSERLSVAPAPKRRERGK